MKKEVDISKLPRAKVFAYSLLPAILLLCVLEGGARLLETVRPPLPADYGMGFNDGSRVFMSTGGPNPSLVTRPQKEISFVSQSFATPKPANTYRIFFLGESNVYNLQSHLPDLAKRLTGASAAGRRCEIINVGGQAYGSSRLLRVAQEIIEYEPDLILVYIGHNEFEEIDYEALAAPQRLAVQQQVYRSALMRLVRDTVVKVEIGGMRYWMSRFRHPPEVAAWLAFEHEFSPAELDERMAGYRKNMAEILALCRDRGVPVIMGVMATNLRSPILRPNSTDGREKIETMYRANDFQNAMAFARRVLASSTRHQASDAENAIIRQLAKEYGVVLVDIEAAIAKAEPHGVPGETLLYDRCHLNDAGKSILIREYETEIRRLAGLPALAP